MKQTMPLEPDDESRKPQPDGQGKLNNYSDRIRRPIPSTEWDDDITLSPPAIPPPIRSDQLFVPMITRMRQNYDIQKIREAVVFYIIACIGILLVFSLLFISAIGGWSHLLFFQLPTSPAPGGGNNTTVVVIATSQVTTTTTSGLPGSTPTVTQRLSMTPTPFVYTTSTPTSGLVPTPTIGITQTPMPGITPTPILTSSPTSPPVPESTPTPIPTSPPTPIPVPTPTPIPSSSSSCTVTYIVYTQWPQGFTGGIVITNNGSSSINGWVLLFTFPDTQQIDQGWNMNYTEQGGQVIATNLSYNSTILPGSSIVMGFNASWSGNNANPTAFILNGSACSIF